MKKTKTTQERLESIYYGDQHAETMKKTVEEPIKEKELVNPPRPYRTIQLVPRHERINEKDADKLISRMSSFMPWEYLRKEECDKRLKSALTSMDERAYERIDHIIFRTKAYRFCAYLVSIFFGWIGLDRILHGYKKSGFFKMFLALLSVAVFLSPILFNNLWPITFPKIITDYLEFYPVYFSVLVMPTIWWIIDIFALNGISERAKKNNYRQFMASLQGIRRDIAMDDDPLTRGF